MSGFSRTDDRAADDRKRDDDSHERQYRMTACATTSSAWRWAWPLDSLRQPHTDRRARRWRTHASGTFDVKIIPQKDEGVGDATIARMSIDKQYHGDLEGTGLGQMLAGMAAEVKDSGAYVAIERVRGTLQGRTGSFAVHHRGVMTRGAQDLTITSSLTPAPGSSPASPAR